MSTTESALPATTATVSATPELNGDLLTDAQMIEIFGNEFSKSAPTPEAAAAPAAPETAQATDTADGEAPLLDMTALETLDTAETDTSSTAGTPPVSDPFVEKLRVAIPNEVALNYAVDAFQKQTDFERAVDGGNLADAVKAMPAAGKLFQAGLAQVLANPEFEKQVVENFIRKNSPENQNPQVNALLQKVAQLEARFQSDDTRAAQQQQLAAQQKQAEANKAAVEGIDREITSLFDKVTFTKNEADRNVVTALFKVALSSDPEAMRKALAGDTSVIRPIFKKVATEFADREKARAPRVGSLKTTPAPILTGASVTAETPLKGMDAAFAKAAQFVANNPRG